MNTTSTPTPDYLIPYAEELGEELACNLFLEFGGSTVYLGEKSRKGSKIRTVLDENKCAALAKRMGSGLLKIPLARHWTATVLKNQGNSTGEIARLVRADEETVRRWLKLENRKDGIGGKQLNFLDN